MSYLYRADGTQIDVGGGGGISEVKLENLAFGNAYKIESKAMKLVYIGADATANGWTGKIIKCKAGDSVYFNYEAVTQFSNGIWVLDNYPDSEVYNYQDLAIKNHRLAVYDDSDVVEIEYMPDGETVRWYKFTVPSNLTTTQSVFVCGHFGRYLPSVFGAGSDYIISTYDFNTLPEYFVKHQSESFVLDDNINMRSYHGLHNGIERMFGANVLVLGDSITMMSAYDYGNRLNFPFRTDHGGVWECGTGRMYGGYGYYSRIARKYYQTFTTRGRSNACWTPRPTSATPYSCVYDVKDFCNNANIAHDAFDYIVIEYGTNDILFRSGYFGSLTDVASDADEATSVSAIRYCIENLQAKFDTAAIVVIMPTLMLDSNSIQANQDTYIELTSKVFKEYGVKCCYPHYEAGITADMICGDGIHLDYRAIYNPDKTDKTSDNNNQGVARYSRCLEAAMLEA